MAPACSTLALLALVFASSALTAVAAPSHVVFTPVHDGPYETNPLPLRPTLREQRENAVWKHHIHNSKAAFALKTLDDELAIPSHPRFIAEFEPMQGTLIRYPLGIPLPFVKDLSQHVKVFTLVTSQLESAAAKDFSDAGVNMANVEFINAKTNSYWTRDFGAWWVAYGDDPAEDPDIAIVDFTYDSYRPLDNQVNQILSTYFDVPYFFSGITHTGGNMMTTGTDLGASTTLVYQTNGNNVSLVTSTMLSYYGIKDYFVTPDPTGTYIEHIDTWAKFLSVDRVLVRRVAVLDRSYDETEAAANEFSKLKVQVAGAVRNVRVFRIDIEDPDNDAYLNSYIINGRVYVPIRESEDNPKDARALQAYRDALPSGYVVIGVPPVKQTPWLSTDALHCRVNSIPRFD